MYGHAVSAAGSSAVTGQPLLEQIFTIQRRVKGLRSAQQSKWYRGSIIQAFVFAGFCRDESFFLFNFRPLLLTAQKGVFIMNSLVILLIVACFLIVLGVLVAVTCIRKLVSTVAGKAEA